MPSRYQPDSRARGPAALAAIAVQAGLAYVLISGLAEKVASAERPLEVTSIPAEPLASPPPPTPTPTPRVEEHGGAPPKAAGAAGRKAEATQVVAPRPRIVLAPPPPIVVAPVAGTGNAARAGAAAAGTGPGAGGVGDGAGGGGAGGYGGGTGDGVGGAGGGRGPERVAGGLRDSDYPAAAAREYASGTVFIRLRIRADGRVQGCEVTRSSGSAVLDETTCRLAARRFRYRPALNAAGRPVPSIDTTNFTWGTRLR